eukprot:SAG22_NODE_1372_length_4577_cov_3.556052_2_plen_89_part_00
MRADVKKYEEEETMDKTQQMLQKIDRIAQLQNEINQSAPRLARVTQEQESAVQAAVREGVENYLASWRPRQRAAAAGLSCSSRCRCSV